MELSQFCSQRGVKRQKDAVDALTVMLSQIDPGGNAQPIVENLLEQYICVEPIFEMSAKGLMEQSNINKRMAEAIDLIDELCRYRAREKFGLHPKLDTFRKAADYLVLNFKGIYVEHCVLLGLTREGKLIDNVLLQKGTINESSLYVRDLVENALYMGAKYTVLCHNHPGGTTTPSPADYEATRSVMDALQTVNIPLLDHIVVADQRALSIRRGRRIAEEAWVSQADFAPLCKKWFSDYK